MNSRLFLFVYLCVHPLNIFCTDQEVTTEDIAKTLEKIFKESYEKDRLEHPEKYIPKPATAAKNDPLILDKNKPDDLAPLRECLKECQETLEKALYEARNKTTNKIPNKAAIFVVDKITRLLATIIPFLAGTNKINTSSMQADSSKNIKKYAHEWKQFDGTLSSENFNTTNAQTLLESIKSLLSHGTSKEIIAKALALRMKEEGRLLRNICGLPNLPTDTAAFCAGILGVKPDEMPLFLATIVEFFIEEKSEKLEEYIDCMETLVLAATSSELFEIAVLKTALLDCCSTEISILCAQKAKMLTENMNDHLENINNLILGKVGLPILLTEHQLSLKLFEECLHERLAPHDFSEQVGQSIQRQKKILSASYKYNLNCLKRHLSNVSSTVKKIFNQKIK